MPYRYLRRLTVAALAGSVLAVGLVASNGAFYAQAANQPELTFLGRYTTGLANPADEVSSGEVVAYENKRMYVTNATAARLDLVDIDKHGNPSLFKTVDMTQFFPDDFDSDPDTITELTSVSVKNGIVAAALKADDKVSPGKVVFLSRDGNYLGQVQVGSLPDMVTFSTFGLRLLVANEGEPDCYGPGCTDPEGSVTIVSVLPYLAGSWLGWVPPGSVKTVSFSDFNAGGPRDSELPSDVRIFGPGASVAQDLEPEYISVGPDLITAYVTLQENNAVAAINIVSGKVEKIFALGYKDHGLPGNGLDPSDKDGGANIATWPVKGMYQPDSIDSYRAGWQTYFVTANEGDARDYDGFAEESRMKDLSLSDALKAFKDNAMLGRLNVTTTLGKGADGKYSELYAFGARSFSIWNANTGQQVFDSGDQFEQTVKSLGIPFNVSNTDVEADGRSDNKGPEPEALTIGTVKNRSYAFIGLEREGGVMVYDITNPAAPAFVQYMVTRDFSQDAAPDSGPEVLVFIDGSESPTKKPMLLISNEITGTIVVAEFK
ncbi:MAG: choice-of-anchor I family protein [Dehalococcoidia bacterium]